MLAGPGAISTIIILQTQATTLAQHVALPVCILLVAGATYAVFRLAVHGAHRLSPIAMSIAVRIMGMLLAAVAMQFLLNGIRSFRSDLLAGILK